MMPLLSATNLSIQGRLHETSLELAAGQLTCLIGPNGSGKTSLLHALAGVGRAAGEVRVDGQNPRSSGPSDRQRLLSFLPASRDVKWPLKASDLILLGLPDCSKAHDDLIDALDLQPLLHRRMDQISTGERSRVLLARALAARPRMLLLDEPIANLDPLWQLRVLDYLVSLSGEGRGVLVALHDLEAARRYADRLIIMDEGRIYADSGAADLLGGPAIPDVFGVKWTGVEWQAA